MASRLVMLLLMGLGWEQDSLEEDQQHWGEFQTEELLRGLSLQFYQSA